MNSLSFIIEYVCLTEQLWPARIPPSQTNFLPRCHFKKVLKPLTEYLRRRTMCERILRRPLQASNNLMKFCCHGGKLPLNLAMKMLAAGDHSDSESDGSESEGEADEDGSSAANGACEHGSNAAAGDGDNGKVVAAAPACEAHLHRVSDADAKVGVDGVALGEPAN